MKKLAFIGNAEKPDYLLDMFRKQTPKREGIWKNLLGVPRLDQADYYAVIDFIPAWQRSQVDESKCVFLGAHPETIGAYHNMDSYKGIKMYDCKNTFGFGEWWIKYDYDFLSRLQPTRKIKDLCCIMSDANTTPYHKLRREYLNNFCKNYKLKCDVFGRIKPWGYIEECYHGELGSKDARGNATTGGNDHMSGKEPVYEKYQYALEFDVSGKYYFSERIFDSLLLWCMPFYYGCENIHDFLPTESVFKISPEAQGGDVMNKIYTKIDGFTAYEVATPAISEARDLLLNKYQIWPRVHEAIFGEP
jgi:hypothetical protein